MCIVAQNMGSFSGSNDLGQRYSRFSCAKVLALLFGHKLLGELSNDWLYNSWYE